MKQAIVLPLCLATLVSCTSTKPLDIISQEFVYHIQADDLKTFTYQVELQSDKNLLSAQGLTGSRKVGKGAVNDSVNIRQKTDYRPQLLKRVKTSHRERAIKSLESHFQQSPFCRQGYQLNDEFIGLQSLKFHGQCRELANAKDKALFPNASSRHTKANLGLSAE